MKKMNKKSRIIISLALSVCFLIVGAVVVGNVKKSKAAEQTKEVATGSNNQDNITMFQAYEWDTDRDGQHWNRVANMATELSNLGISQVWLPPAYKGMYGVDDTGYNPYDLYDLGEFCGNTEQPILRTRYGTKDQYLNAIKQLQSKGIKVLADVVLNHKAGGEKPEEVVCTEVDANNRYKVKSTNTKILAYTKFNFDVYGERSRNNTYSSFKWDASCFDGANWDCNFGDAYNKSKNSIYLFNGKQWDNEVDPEFGNYDFLTHLDVDFDNQKVVDELTNWGEWYVNTTGIDGFRLDAVKHIKFDFFNKWVSDVSRRTGRDFDVVAEYLDGDVNVIDNYIQKTNHNFDVFDFPLWYRFRDASKGNFDLRGLFSGSLTEKDPDVAVMFVDNHDTQVGKERAIYSVDQWFKAPAYASILTRQGKACVFYGDYNGTNEVAGGYEGTCKSIKNELEPLLYARKNYAYGEQVDYFQNPDYIGWVRKGDYAHEGSGLATLIADNNYGGSITMNVGSQHAGETWYDMTGDVKETVKIDNNGYGTFSVKGKKNGKCYSVWVRDNSKSTSNMSNGKLSNKVKIYYKGELEDVSIMYGINNDNWTSVPGVQMESSQYEGYKEIVIDIQDGDELKFCFTDGRGNWENNDNNNYTAFSPGEYTILNGVVIRDNPKI